MKLLAKLTSTKTVISIASLVILILTSCGAQINNEQIMTIVKAICGIGVLIGVMNDTGMNTTTWNDKEKVKKQ